jgi:hypothetical protein
MQVSPKGKPFIFRHNFLIIQWDARETSVGLLVPFSKIWPKVPTSLTLSAQQASSQKQSNQITKGETVRYIEDEGQALWLVMGVGDQDGEKMVNITTVCHY